MGQVRKKGRKWTDTRGGSGIMVYQNGRIYEGQWKNDLRCGLGIEHFPNGSLFKGEFADG